MLFTKAEVTALSEWCGSFKSGEGCRSAPSGARRSDLTSLSHDNPRHPTELRELRQLESGSCGAEAAANSISCGLEAACNACGTALIYQARRFWVCARPDFGKLIPQSALRCMRLHQTINIYAFRFFHNPDGHIPFLAAEGSLEVVSTINLGALLEGIIQQGCG